MNTPSNQHWMAKTIAKIMLVSAVFVVFSSVLGTLFPQLSLDTITPLLFTMAFLIFSAYRRFFSNTHTMPKSLTQDVGAMVLELGGLVKASANTGQVDHKKRVEDWLQKNIPQGKVPDLIEKGEIQFTSEDGASYDLLLDFIQLQNHAGEPLEAIVIQKGNAKQLQFFQQLAKVNLVWKCERVN
jgi:hypothetical protein